SNIVDLLKAKSAAGVDVRVLGWVMPPDILNNPVVARGGIPSLNDMVNLNEKTMRCIDALRKADKSLADKAQLNVISHPAGAVHTKMAVVGGSPGDVAFTGGIDLQPFRAR